MLHLRWLVLVLLAVPLRVGAELVERDLSWRDGWSYGPYVGAVTYDTKTGLEWLDLTQKQGTTRSWLLYPEGDNYHNPLFYGWRYANRSEVCGLLESRTGPILGCSGQSGGDFGSYEGIVEIQEFLGVTDEDWEARFSYGIFATSEVQMIVRPSDEFAAAIVVIDRPDSPPDGGPNYGHFLVRVPEVRSAVLLLLAACALIRERAR